MAGQPLGTESEDKSILSPAYSAKVCFIAAAVAGDITTTVNRGRQARPMSNLLLLDVYDLTFTYSPIHTLTVSPS